MMPWLILSRVSLLVPMKEGQPSARRGRTKPIRWFREIRLATGLKTVAAMFCARSSMQAHVPVHAQRTWRTSARNACTLVTLPRITTSMPPPQVVREEAVRVGGETRGTGEAEKQSTPKVDGSLERGERREGGKGACYSAHPTPITESMFQSCVASLSSSRPSSTGRKSHRTI